MFKQTYIIFYDFYIYNQNVFTQLHAGIKENIIWNTFDTRSGGLKIMKSDGNVPTGEWTQGHSL